MLIDDVWSGGSKKDGNYPLMSYAIECGLYHPRCKDSHTTYFPGISTADDTWTKEELEAIETKSKKEAKRQAEKFGRLAKYSLDKDNKRTYRNKAKQWEEISDGHNFANLLEESENLLVNSDDFDIIKSGAVSGARNPYGDAADEHAKKY